MRQLIFILCFIPVFGFSSPLVEPSENIDVKKYVFEISINDSTDIIGGIAEITFSSKKEISEFTLDLISKNSQGKGMEVVSVSSKSTSLKFEHKQNRLRILLDKS